MMVEVIHILLHMQTPFPFVTCLARTILLVSVTHTHTHAHTHSTAGWTLQTAWRYREGVSTEFHCFRIYEKTHLEEKRENRLMRGGGGRVERKQCVCLGS